MTAQQFRDRINRWGDEYGLENPYPSPEEVDADTYANVVKYLVNHRISKEDYVLIGNSKLISLFFGPNNGIMFKGIELIFKEKE